MFIAYDNYYPESMVTGEYIYRYRYPSVLAESPHNGDKLLLKENGHFQSDTWGEGTYELRNGRLVLNYHDQMGEASFKTSFNREFFWSKPRIIIDYDLGHYFEKVD
jgi:hypothetical protein